MSKLIISKLLVERVAQSLHNRNSLFSSKLLPLDANADVLEEAGKQAFKLLTCEEPGLLIFFLIYTSPLSDESRQVGLFLSEVIFDTFRLAGWTVRCADKDEFIAAFKANHELIKKVAYAHPKFADQYIWNEILKDQPELIRYIVAVLCTKHSTCPHNLPPDDLARLLMVLKSVVDVLDSDSYVNPNAN